MTFDEWRNKWDAFAHGEWTKDPPTKPGNYPVADREGKQGGQIVVFIHADGTLHAATYGHSGPVKEVWQGWWWSEPLPSMRKPPEW